MRILTLNYEFPPIGGGGAPVSHELGKELVAQGHDVDVVTMGFNGLPAREVPRKMAEFLPQTTDPRVEKRLV